MKSGKSGGSVLAVNQTATKTLITEAFPCGEVKQTQTFRRYKGGVRGKEGRRQAAHVTVDSLIPVPNLLSLFFKMSNYRIWQSKQAFHCIMILPFFAGSNFKLKTSLHSTKNFSFLDACTSIVVL
jgi:hypothetical protein